MGPRRILALKFQSLFLPSTNSNEHLKDTLEQPCPNQTRRHPMKQRHTRSPKGIRGKLSVVTNCSRTFTFQSQLNPPDYEMAVLQETWFEL